jgi:hypothetical protein
MYLTHQITEGQPVFILVLPFEQKDKARQYGFTWNNPQPGAWASSNISTAIAPIRGGEAVSVAPDTLSYIKDHTAMTDETYDRLKAAYVEPTRKEKAAIESAIMSDQQAAAVHQGLQLLASVCDGAVSDDRAGFNRNDLEYGHKLAQSPSLSRSQAGYGKLMLEKYRGQLGDDLYQSIFPEKYAAEKAAAAKKVDDKAEKAASKMHKKGQLCDWSGCDQCRHQRVTEASAAAIKANRKPIQLPASPVELVKVEVLHEDGSREDITDQPERHYPEPPAEKVQAADEATRLAESLATCHPADFDTTVDLLRALRKIDEPVKAGSDFTKDAWKAAGYQVK